MPPRWNPPARRKACWKVSRRPLDSTPLSTARCSQNSFSAATFSVVRAAQLVHITWFQFFDAAPRDHAAAAPRCDMLPLTSSKRYAKPPLTFSQPRTVRIALHKPFAANRPSFLLQLRPRQPSPWIQWSTSSLLRSHSHGAAQRQHFSPQRSRQFRAQVFAPDARRNRMRGLVHSNIQQWFCDAYLV